MYWISRLEKLKREQRSQFYAERPFLRLPLPLCPPQLEEIEPSVEHDADVGHGVVVFEINSVEKISN